MKATSGAVRIWGLKTTLGSGAKIKKQPLWSSYCVIQAIHSATGVTGGIGLGRRIIPIKIHPEEDSKLKQKRLETTGNIQSERVQLRRTWNRLEKRLQKEELQAQLRRA